MRSLGQTIVEEMLDEDGVRPLCVGDVVPHPESGRMVGITDGQYWGTYGLSNFWDWEDVETGEKDCGYGWHIKKAPNPTTKRGR